MGCGGGGRSGILGEAIISDLMGGTDKKRVPGGETVIIAWIMGCVAFPIIAFIGLWLKAYSLEVGVYGFIGLGLWACGHYGTNRSIVSRFRYRYTKQERLIIKRRLSE